MSPNSFSVTKKVVLSERSDLQPSVSWEYIDSVLGEKLDKISYSSNMMFLNRTFSKMMPLL